MKNTLLIATILVHSAAFAAQPALSPAHVKNKLTDNTIVLFMSDNGGLSSPARGGKIDTQNLPLSCGKGSLREGGIHEPMIVKWPGVTKPGSSCNDYLIIEDFFPTILELAGTKHSKPVDGVSFVPMIKGKTGISKHRPLFWHYPNIWGDQNLVGYGPSSAVRLDDWKYIFYHDPGKKIREELFNIRKDIGETKNLAAANPKKMKELRAILKQHLVNVDAQMPADKKTRKIIEIP